MSVLIKGINPPKSCYTCDWYNKVQCPVNDGKCYYRTTRHPNCPLTEIPTPHGRLIDADEFEREFNNHLLPILVKKYGEEEALKGLHFSFRDCICNIQCQKTVIEGSEE